MYLWSLLNDNDVSIILTRYIFPKSTDYLYEFPL